VPAPARELPPALCFTKDDSDDANGSWGANCGPHSLAASLGLNLAQVRTGLGTFRGWMSPTMIEHALSSLGAEYAVRKGLKTATLCGGVSRIQWEGPWLDKGVPASVAYHHTHWVAHVDGWVLCTVVNPSEWVRISEWGNALRSLGYSWHVTHHYILVRGGL
jgi:hypothetical protein